SQFLLDDFEMPVLLAAETSRRGVVRDDKPRCTRSSTQIRGNTPSRIWIFFTGKRSPSSRPLRRPLPRRRRSPDRLEHRNVFPGFHQHPYAYSTVPFTPGQQVHLFPH